MTKKGTGLVLRWPLEQPKQQRWKGLALGLLCSLLLALGERAYVWLKPLDPHVAGAEAFWCQFDYARARTMIDTLRVDEGSYVITNVPLQRNPTCGEVRLKYPPPSNSIRVPPPRRRIVVGPHPQ